MTSPSSKLSKPSIWMPHSKFVATSRTSSWNRFSVEILPSAMHRAVALHARRVGARDRAVADVGAGDRVLARDAEDLPHLGVGGDDLLEGRLQHALQRLVDVLDDVVDDVVVPDIDLLGRGDALGAALGARVEGDDDALRGDRQHDVGLRDGARAGVDDLHLHLLVGQPLERRADRLDRALHVRLEDDVQFLELAGADLAEQRVQRDVRLLVHRRRFALADALDHDRARRLVVRRRRAASRPPSAPTAGRGSPPAPTARPT